MTQKIIGLSKISPDNTYEKNRKILYSQAEAAAHTSTKKPIRNLLI